MGLKPLAIKQSDGVLSPFQSAGTLATTSEEIFDADVYQRMELPVCAMQPSGSIQGATLWSTSAPLTLVTSSRLLELIREISSDANQGREAPSPGLDRAAAYIAEQAAAAGLRGGNPSNDNPFFQPFLFTPPAPVRIDCPSEVARQKAAPLKSGVVNNVAAIFDGGDPALKDEIVLVSAHYDHLGMSQGPECGPDRIYNGADDNASGVAVLLQIAELLGEMKKSGFQPKRSILFLWTAAEERGYAGAEHYRSRPLHPIAKTAAAMNVDAVARLDVDKIAVIDTDASDAPNFFRQLLSGAGTLAGFKEVDFRIDREIFRYHFDSDIWNTLNVPTINIYEGQTTDGYLNAALHRPYDDVEGIIQENNGLKVERAAKLALLLLLEAANR